MKRLLFALALLLAGCAGARTASTPTGGALPPVAFSEARQHLLQALTAAPPALREAITREAERARPDATAVKAGTRAALLQLLHAPHHAELRPDRAFARIRRLLPDNHESPQSAYAAALTDFLLDPGLPCRQPIVGRYFRQRYAPANGEPTCESSIPFRVLSRHGEPRVVRVDPARVRALHLLYAGKSRALASRFGHVSLRLVICPRVGSTDAECDLNVEQHLVLGYRAHIDELSMSLFKAVSGGYAAHFYANTFLDVYQEYAIDEFRPVYSLPLKLAPARRNAMVRELAELHFRAAGPYRYMTRNCATLLQDALRVLWPEFAQDRPAHWRYLRPDSFFGALKDLRLVDGVALADAGRAERNGHLFPSTQPYYERAAGVVAAAMATPGFASLQEFLQLDPARRRQDRLADMRYRERLATDSHLREAQVILEEYAMMKSERLMLAALGRYVATRDARQLIAEARGYVRIADRDLLDECLLRPVMSRAGPALSPSGIPDLEEPALFPATAELCRGPQAVAALRDVVNGLLGQPADATDVIRRLADYHAGSLANVQELLGMTAPELQPQR